MDKYNRQKVIGAGAFGQAWLVQSKLDGKSFVMKEIKIARVKLVFIVRFNIHVESSLIHRWIKKHVMVHAKK
jgi:serine/threonine protein kinase